MSSDIEKLSGLLSVRSREFAIRGYLSQADQAAAKLRELEPKTMETLYTAGEAYARCAALVVRGKPEPPEAERAERQKYVDLMLECLKEAVAAGFADFDRLRQESVFMPFHDLPEFQALFPKPPG